MTSNFYLFPFTKLMHQLRKKGAVAVKVLLKSSLVGYFYETKYEIWAVLGCFGLFWAVLGCFGPVGQFRIHEFIIFPISILNSI